MANGDNKHCLGLTAKKGFFLYNKWFSPMKIPTYTSLMKTQIILEKWCWKMLKYPLNSPDVSSPDFHILENFKKISLQRIVFPFGRQSGGRCAALPLKLPQSFFSKDIDLLPKRWDLCCNAHGGFFWFPIKIFFLWICAIFIRATIIKRIVKINNLIFLYYRYSRDI